MPKFLYDVPDILYKYRDWDNPHHKKLLENRELYFASVNQFNDPFDGTIPHRYDSEELTEENIFLKYEQITRREYPMWSDKEVHNHCYEYQQRAHYRDEKFKEDFEAYMLKIINEKFGVVSLCKKRDNFLLWSHYANSHSGFCVGFDKKLLFKDTQAKFAHMQYQNDLPRLSLFDEYSTHFNKLIGTKSKIWRYEKEYRITKIDFARQTIILKKETIVEILLGCKMDQNEKYKIQKFVGEEYPHAKVYDQRLSKTKFETEIFQIR